MEEFIDMFDMIVYGCGYKKFVQPNDHHLLHIIFQMLENEEIENSVEKNYNMILDIMSNLKVNKGGDDEGYLSDPNS